MIKYGYRLAALAAAVAVAAAPTPAQAATLTHEPCRNGYVGLTFDDGPDPAKTPRLLQVLRESGARATFFVVGQNAAEHPGLVRATHRAGMWIGNHSYTHPNLPELGEPAAFGELRDTQHVLRNVTGRRPALFRPPFGATNAQVRFDAARLKLLEVLWTVDSQDWAGATTEQIVEAARTLQPGGIILLHDWAQPSIDAVPQIVRDLRARGLCPGRIAFTPREIPYGDTHFHAVAVRP